MSQEFKPPVLIAGAGPTGLVLALNLARRGVPFRVVDDEAAPGEHSRAMVVHARTLEFYRQFGFAEEVVEGGVEIATGRLREGGQGGGGREVVAFSFRDMGKHQSPFGTPLAYPQDDHERLLVEKLREAGGEVEWDTRLESFTQDADGVDAVLLHGGGRTETVRASFLCGCDGGHSTVRRGLGVGFTGGTYEQLYYVADVKISRGFVCDFVLNMGAKSFALLLPVRSRGVQRIIGLVPVEFGERSDLTFDEVRDQIEPLVDVKVTEVNWFSTYKVHHRVAEHFQRGRAFLAGDAAHVHSPVGAQGMNTGIGDAMNLGWKLAQVMQGRADAALLESYEPERIAFARRLVATTDQVFKVIVSPGRIGKAGRQVVLPALMSVGTKIDVVREELFRAVSQLQIAYAHSPISRGKAGSVKGGDRLPWMDDGTDNFAPLRSLDWQVHVYGTPYESLRKACARMQLALDVFPWNEAARRAGFAKDGAYLVRPDGYVAVAVDGKDAADGFGSFAEEHGLSFGT